MFVPADVFDEKGGTFAEEIAGKGKDYRPGERTEQVQPGKLFARKACHAQDDWKDYPESIGISGNKGNERAIFLDQKHCLAQLPSY